MMYLQQALPHILPSCIHQAPRLRTPGLLHVALGAFTAHLSGERFFSTGDRGSPNGAWNKIVTHAPMKPNKTSHYRDEKLFHYHGNCEEHSQRAGWVTRKERVEEKWMENEGICKEICMNEEMDIIGRDDIDRVGPPPQSDKCVKDGISSQCRLCSLSHYNTPVHYLSLTPPMLTTN